MATKEQTQYTAEQHAQLVALLEQERAKNAALLAEKAKRDNGPVTVKLSKDGRKVSVYGLGRFPVTLWPKQWSRLLSQVQAIRDMLPLCIADDQAESAES